MKHNAKFIQKQSRFSKDYRKNIAKHCQKTGKSGNMKLINETLDQSVAGSSNAANQIFLNQTPIPEVESFSKINAQSTSVGIS